MQVTTKRSILLLGLLVLAHATAPACAAETQVVSTFEGNKGPGWKAAANVMAAVGPRHVVDFTMGGFTVHDKATGKTLRHLTQGEFWKLVEPAESLAPRKEANDPWIVYDPVSGRWFATVAGTDPADSFLAVSASSDPMQPWKGVKLPLPSIDPGLKIGVDRNALYISCANGSSNPNEALDLYVIPKADAIDPAGPVLSRAQTFSKLVYAAVPAVDLDPGKAAHAPAVLLNNEFGSPTCSRLYLYRITWSGSQASISAAQAIPLSQTYQTPRMEGIQPEGGVRLVQSGGRRNNCAFARGGSVFGCNGAQRKADSRPGILWYEVRIRDGVVLQEGLVDDPDCDYLYPSMAVDSRGNIGIGCTRTSATDFPSVCVMMHAVGDPAGTMRSPVVAVKGTTVFKYSGVIAINFSNYSTTCIDPSAADLLWTYQGYANSTVDRQWCTAWAAFRLGAAGDAQLQGDGTAKAGAPVNAIDAGERGAPTAFTGEKTSWYGFDRFDFQMDGAALTVQPITASRDDGTGINRQVAGQLRCIVVAPKDSLPGKPWSWRGRYFDHEPQVEIELLKRGFHIAFVQADAGKPWDAWYAFLTQTHGLSTKPAFIGMSGGGRNAFTWTTTNPDNVSCIYADNPLLTRESLTKLGELAQRDVPLLHICGSLDPLTASHTLPVESIYQQLGGRISVMIKDGAGHHPHSLRDPTLIADFLTRSLEPAGPAPAFAGTEFTKSSFYGVENSYRDFPQEGLYITCRGPWFSKSYDRYAFKPDGMTGSVNVIVPRMAAAGRPWVMRPDMVSRDAEVDLALLHRGFHIVTAPRPRDPNGTVLAEWNALYKYLIDQGFSTKPVMEGAGAAAGEAYAWAIANPDNVSCIYAQNPVLRSNISKTQPLDDLAPMAKAGVHILHLCGSLDPWLESQTRVAQKRYEELGGRITVIIKEGAGHYLLAAKDQQRIVNFIITHANPGTQ